MQTKKQLRAADALRQLMEGGNATFFTFTTPDVVDYETISARWREVRHDLVQAMRRRTGVSPQYVMNFEKHPGYLQKVVSADTFEESIIRSDGLSHGWHIHGVMNRYIDLKYYLRMIQSVGFGRVDVRRVTSEGVSDYLTKHALKAYRGISSRERQRCGVERLRLVNTSRGLPSLASYRSESAFLDKCRYMMHLQLMDIRAAGFKVSNALVLWKRAEVAAMFDGITDPRALYLIESERQQHNRNYFLQHM